MSYKIKSWSKFQHFKDRKPPWIKLYRDILDDREWHKLNAESAKLLVSLWLIGSEHSGELPDVEELSFRLRLPKNHIEKCLKDLGHWLISERYQDDIKMEQKILVADIKTPPRDREETEKRKEEASATANAFAEFWTAYPKKVGKDAAQKAFEKRKVDEKTLADMLSALEAQKLSDDWKKENGKFIPHPTTWLNQGRWKDGEEEEPKQSYRLENGLMYNPATGMTWL